jgi:hypothetical protein
MLSMALRLLALLALPAFLAGCVGDASTQYMGDCVWTSPDLRVEVLSHRFSSDRAEMRVNYTNRRDFGMVYAFDGADHPRLEVKDGYVELDRDPSGRAVDIYPGESVQFLLATREPIALEQEWRSLADRYRVQGRDGDVDNRTVVIDLTDCRTTPHSSATS